MAPTRPRSSAGGQVPAASTADRRELHKVLGDDTRHALWVTLRESTCPLTTAELAERIGLHPNTIRPHLDRLRTVGLVDREIARQGEIGRPQHRYSAVTPNDVPGPSADGEALTLLAEAMLSMVRDGGSTSADARRSGAATGIQLVAHRAKKDESIGSVVERLTNDLDRLGFEPEVKEQDLGESAEISFSRCPFGALADEAPDIVCSIHHGLIEGFASDTTVLDFVGPSVDDTCKVLVNVNHAHKIDPSPATGA